MARGSFVQARFVTIRRTTADAVQRRLFAAQTRVLQRINLCKITEARDALAFRARVLIKMHVARKKQNAMRVHVSPKHTCSGVALIYITDATPRPAPPWRIRARAAKKK
jgi:hypothetical protein